MEHFKFRKGDVVTIEATVRHDTPDGAKYVTLELDYSTHSTELSNVTLARKHFALGEFVSFNAPGGSAFEVVGVHGGHAWIVDSSGSPDTFPLASLTLADKPLWAHERDGTTPPAPYVDGVEERLAENVAAEPEAAPALDEPRDPYQHAAE